MKFGMKFVEYIHRPAVAGTSELLEHHSEKLNNIKNMSQNQYFSYNLLSCLLNYLMQNSANSYKCRLWIFKENSYRTLNEVNAIFRSKINSFL